MTLLEKLQAVGEQAHAANLDYSVEQLAAAIATVEAMETLADEGREDISAWKLRALLNGDAP